MLRSIPVFALLLVGAGLVTFAEANKIGVASTQNEVKKVG